MAGRILAGDNFKSGTLGGVLTSMQFAPELPVQLSALLRSEALVRLRIAEDPSGRKTVEVANNDAAAALDKVKRALALNPSDSFLWLMLYSTENVSRGFDMRSLRILDESYATGPLEGWISLRRNSLALAVFPSLGEQAKLKVVVEFKKLVDGEFIDLAAINLTGIGWAHRERLLASLETINSIPREAFARKLAQDGVKVAVPGTPTDERLWHR